MAKEADLIVRILSDANCSDKMYEALTEELEKDPVAFYKNFVEPRSGKIDLAAAGDLVSKLTIIQEVARMDRTTAPPPLKGVDVKDKTDK